MPWVEGEYVEPMNEDRAGWALEAVQTFAERTRNRPDEQVVLFDSENLEELVQDLLTDLHHLVDAGDLDWEMLTLSAQGNYNEEVWEEKHPGEEMEE